VLPVAMTLLVCGFFLWDWDALVAVDPRHRTAR
jgi:hypothetical protein